MNSKKVVLNVGLRLIFVFFPLVLSYDVRAESFRSRLFSGAVTAFSGNGIWNNWRRDYLKTNFFTLLTDDAQQFGALFKKLVARKLNGQFFFGASSSHLQFEGGYEKVRNNQGEAADSTQYHKELNQDEALPGQAANFWEDYKKIIPNLKKELGLKMLRISISWARIQPNTDTSWNENAIKRYVDIVKTLRQYDIEPLVVFHHYTNPLWFEQIGGFEYADNIDCFINFAVKMYQSLAPHVSYFSTMNGAEAFAFRAYYTAESAPFRKGEMQMATIVTAHMLEAHVRIYQKIHAMYETIKMKNPKIAEPKVGIQKVVHPIDAADKTIIQNLCKPLSSIFASIGNMIQNDAIYQFFTHGVFELYIPGKVDFRLENANAPDALDWIGINTYSNRQLFFTKSVTETDEKLKTGSGHYYYYPQGIFRAVQIVHEKLVKPFEERGKKLPIIITENGIAALSEVQREQYYKEALVNIAFCILKGYPLIAYLPWSVTDCYEWRTGNSNKSYGLIEVQFATSDKEKPQIKQVKEGARYYRDFISAMYV
jgi:beta-glucosidase